MHISIGSDHRGLAVKQYLIGFLQGLGHKVDDEGTRSEASCDYPDFAAVVARRVSNHDVDRGVLICGTGVGMSIAANKVKGVRAATCGDKQTAELIRQHNDTNVLCLSEKLLGQPQLDEIVKTWLATEFDGDRHTQRLEKIAALET